MVGIMGIAYVFAASVLWTCSSGTLIHILTDNHFTVYGRTPQEFRQLGALQFQTVKVSSRIHCCVVCDEISTCIGAAWKKAGHLCKLASRRSNDLEYILSMEDGWKLFVKDDILIKGPGEYNGSLSRTMCNTIMATCYYYRDTLRKGPHK